jgi:hypothetical protein
VNAELERAFIAARTAIAAARAAPLSRKKAMLAILLVDASADAAFATSGEDDLLAFRERLATGSDALALVFALAAQLEDGPRLVVEPVEVLVADYPGLGVEDFMVSLYNGRTVQRVRIATGAERRDVHEALAAALEALAI